MSNSDLWLGRIGRALSLRVIVIALVGGIAFGVLAGLVWSGAAWPVTIIAAIGLYLIAVMNDGQMVKCDACGKRVKLGYSTCHHCGYSRA